MAGPLDYQGNSLQPYPGLRQAPPQSLGDVAAALGVQPAPKRTPQAELALKALVGEIQSLHADVSTLLDRLSPVLRPEPPAKEPDGMARPITGAALIDGIQDQVASLSRLRGVVRGAIDRLEV